MILTEVSAPPAAAVPVRAFAEHLRLGSGFADDGSEDAVLELYLRAAMAAIEARLGRALLAREFVLDGDALARGREPGPAGRAGAIGRCDHAGRRRRRRDGGRSGELVGAARQPAAAAGRALRAQPAADPAGGAGGDPVHRRLRRGLGRCAGRPAAGGVPAGRAFLREPRRGRRRHDALRGAGADRGLPRDPDRAGGFRDGGPADAAADARGARRASPTAPAGSSSAWVPVGTIWADVRPGSGARTSPAPRCGRGSRCRILVRGAPAGSPSRPRADQRLREGARVFDILTVTEHDPAGRFLEILGRGRDAAVSLRFRLAAGQGLSAPCRRCGARRPGRRRDLRRAARPGRGRPAPDYVTLGEETVRANGTKTSAGRDARLHGDRAFRARRVRGGEADRGGGLRLPGRCAAGARGGAGWSRCASCAPGRNAGRRRRSAR